MLALGQITIVVYALLILIGGTYGFIHKGSVPSLIASAILCVLMFSTLATMRNNPKLGLGLGALLALASLGRFIPTYFAKHVFFPNGLFSLIGVIATVIIGLAWLQQSR